MAVLNILLRSGVRRSRWLLACLLLPLLVAEAPAQPGASREYQIKAVFLFNFAQFVEWPAAAFADAQAPIVIGVLGDDPFGSYLDEIVQGEKVNRRLLVVQRYHRVDEIKACHILFVGTTRDNEGVEPVLRDLKNRSILTVGDSDGFALNGGMIRFFTDNNKVRFRINLGAVKATGLILSSKLLRPAEIVASNAKE